MKFLILDTYYPEFINAFYEKDKTLKNKSYQEQKKVLLDGFFSISNSYVRNLRKLGHWAEECITNNERSQKQWAKENGLKFNNLLDKIFPKITYLIRLIKLDLIYKRLESQIKKHQPDLYINDFNRLARGETWFYKILEAQIKKYRPDILYVVDLWFYNPKFLEKIKKYTKLLVGQIGCRLSSKKYLEPYDLIISSVPYYVERFRKWGKNSEYLKYAFEPTILDKLKKRDEQYEIVHIGGYGPTYNERRELLEKAGQKIKIDFWGYSTENLNQNSPILKNYHGEIWGIDMYNIFYNSKIVINCHHSLAKNYAVAIRLYEATGSGAMLITDRKDNLNEIFEIGKEVETYSSAEELTEKLRYYLSHEEERKKIAQAGQKKTLREHNYENRMKELLNIISKYARI